MSWDNTIREALEDCNAHNLLTEEQIKCVIGWCEGYHENYSMFCGYDNIPNPQDKEIEQIKKRSVEQIAELEKQILAYRKSVAVRRNVDISDIYLDNDNVMIKGR